MNPTRLGKMIFVGILSLFGLTSIGCLVEHVSPSEYVRIQYPTGSYSWFLPPGPKLQLFGDPVAYPQRGTIFFKNTEAGDQRLKIQFNEGGTAVISGSINYELPANPLQLNEIHSKYPNQGALEESLIRPALNKSVYLTGTLMTSYESYKERRSQLVQYVDDTVQNGVYQTDSREIEVIDELDPTRKKRATVVVILRGQNGLPLRADTGQLNRFGVRTFNFAIEGLDYDNTVEQQIQGQQKITMQVQTSIAEALQAKQREITTQAEGAANAAKAKWEQETSNAKIIAEADGRRQAAEQDKLAAEQERAARILRAQGDAEARRLVMAADNALDRRLQTMERINQSWANAFANAKQPIVPAMTMGTGGANAASSTQELMNLLTIQTARQLGVQLTPTTGGK